jgi:hypothetical protein
MRWQDPTMSDSSWPFGSVWVRVAEWMWFDGQLPDPVPGWVLPSVGIRVLGTVDEMGPTAEEGILPCAEEPGNTAGAVEYVVTGSVVNADDFQVDTGSGARHAGAELVLTVDGLLFQAQIDGQARDVSLGALVRVRGELFMIAEYEWEDFDLVDTRAPWSIEEALRLPDGDFRLRLLPAPQFA